MSWNTTLQYSKSTVVIPIIWMVLVINCTLSVVATMTNTFILLAIVKTPSLHTPSYILLFSLAASDFIVGFVVQPMSAIFKIAELKTVPNIKCSINIVYVAITRYLTAVSCLTMTSISLDRLLAVLLRLRYRSIVTARRATILVTTIWGTPGLLTGLTTTGEGLSRDSAYLASSASLGLMCILLMSSAYFTSIKILLQTKTSLHSHPAAMELEQQARNSFNLGRYKRSIITVLCLYVVFLFCYVPVVLYAILLLLFEYSLPLHVMGELARTVLFLNSSLNPALCYWRIHDLRRAVRAMLSRDSHPNSP